MRLSPALRLGCIAGLRVTGSVVARPASSAKSIMRLWWLRLGGLRRQCLTAATAVVSLTLSWSWITAMRLRPLGGGSAPTATYR